MVKDKGDFFSYDGYMPKGKKSFNYLPWLYWIGLIGFAGISRWIFKSTYLFHHDSVQFALALNNFDITNHQPHPPGYIFYIWISKFVNYFVDNPNLAFIILGIVATVVGLVAIFLIAREAFGSTAGYIAGVIFVINSSIWFHGLVAEVYIVEASVILIALLFIYRFWKHGKKIDLLWMAILIGLVGGFRQTAELFILPVAIYALFSNKKIIIKYWRETLALFLVTNLLWAIPLVSLSGGVATYFKSLSMLTSATVVSTYVAQGINIVITNGSLLWQTIKQAVPVSLVIMFLALLPFIAAESKKRYPINWKAAAWWLWAFIPGVILIQFILMRNPGYGLYFNILILIITAGGIVLISKVVDEWRKSWGRVVATILVIIILAGQSFIFFRLPALSLDYTSASLPSIKWVETILEDILTHIEGNFGSDSSVIFINNDLVFFGVRHLQFYLPEYDIYSYRPKALAYDDESFYWHVKGSDVSEFKTEVSIPPNIDQIVFWGGNSNLPKSENFIWQTTGDGHSIGYFDLTDANTREEITTNANYQYINLADE